MFSFLNYDVLFLSQKKVGTKPSLKTNLVNIIAPDIGHRIQPIIHFPEKDPPNG